MESGQMQEELPIDRPQKMIAYPDKPSRFTLKEWYLNNRFQNRCAEDQQQLADRIIAESYRMINDTAEVCLKNRKETDHQLSVKVKDIEFIKEQVEIQKKEMDQEVEVLLVYKDRIENCNRSIGEKGLNISKNCLAIREGRLGIDLCVDNVELELRKEITVIEGGKAMLIRISEQVNEQIRRLKKMTYSLIRDIQAKGQGLSIDKTNLALKESSSNLSTYHGSVPLDPTNLTQEEWVKLSNQNIEEAQKELVSGRPLRAYIDVLLKQVIEDMRKQCNIVNEAFKRRIEEYKETKTKLENQHFEIVRQANEMSMNITRIEKSIAEKEGFMALAHTRLGNRCQRPDAELCRDEVESYLVNEVREIKENTRSMQQILLEAEASLRYLLRTQIHIEEDLNIKTNSIKIDEVDCTTLRLGMDFRAF